MYCSLNIYAPNWGKLLIKLGYSNHDLIEKYDFTMNINFDFELLNDINFNIKAISANIRAPLLNFFCKEININKIIYVDIDTLLIRDLNFAIKNFPIDKKIILRSVSKPNFSDIKKRENFMPYKSGIIFLKTYNYKFLRYDEDILYFTSVYQSKCWEKKNVWFSDQKSLKIILDKSVELHKILLTAYKLCDWYFLPNSIFWAAKGAIKNSFIWSFNCLIIKKFYNLISLSNKNDFIHFYYLKLFRKLLRIIIFIFFPLNFTYLFIRFIVLKLKRLL